jgi:hypothetical protein
MCIAMSSLLPLLIHMYCYVCCSGYYDTVRVAEPSVLASTLLPTVPQRSTNNVGEVGKKVEEYKPPSGTPYICFLLSLSVI